MAASVGIDEVDKRVQGALEEWVKREVSKATACNPYAQCCICINAPSAFAKECFDSDEMKDVPPVAQGCILCCTCFCVSLTMSLAVPCALVLMPFSIVCSVCCPSSTKVDTVDNSMLNRTTNPSRIPNNRKPLLPGWVEHRVWVDQGKQSYFINEATGEILYERPIAQPQPTPTPTP